MSKKTKLTLNPIDNVPWGAFITLSGRLTDESGETPLEGKEIRLSSAYAPIDWNLAPLPTITRNGGYFSASVQTLRRLASLQPWDIRLRFPGDDQWRESLSNWVYFRTLAHKTNLVLEDTEDNVCLGQKIIFTAFLMDTDGNQPLANRDVHFNGSGVIPIGHNPTIPIPEYITTVKTNLEGKATFTGVTPNTEGRNWTYQAHFYARGNDNGYYEIAHSVIKIFSIGKPTTLDELKKKWFLDFSLSGSSQYNFPPIRRHNGSSISNYTDGNLVSPLIDGQKYMKEWHDSIRSMIGQQNCEVYHAGWRLEGVRTLGQSVSTSDALEVLIDAYGGGVVIYPLIDGNLLTSEINRTSITGLRLHGIWNACIDKRFPSIRGSNHQKFVCMKNPSNPKAILGSIDISRTRWDQSSHIDNDPERDPRNGKPTHDTGVLILGPAVADIEYSFRERWNDNSRTVGLEPAFPSLPMITGHVSSPSVAGPHSVQVLHTYGTSSTPPGYSWSPVGEFSVWAAYLKAIKKACKYIYIEDQYFLPFNWPPAFRGQGRIRDSDIIYQLGEAIKRGVRIAVLVPSNAEDALHIYQKYQRDMGVNYLNKVAFDTSGHFVIASLHNGTSPVYVHSKLMICDDEYVVLGSANICQRSMTYDSELHIGIVDSDNKFAKEFRKKLWSEHLSRPETTLDDPISAYLMFKADTWSGRGGRVRLYLPVHEKSDPPPAHATTITTIIDPYGGPPR